MGAGTAGRGGGGGGVLSGWEIFARYHRGTVLALCVVKMCKNKTGLLSLFFCSFGSCSLLTTDSTSRSISFDKTIAHFCSCFFVILLFLFSCSFSCIFFRHFLGFVCVLKNSSVTLTKQYRPFVRYAIVLTLGNIPVMGNRAGFFVGVREK